jgi:hypothetical protein
LTCPSIPTLEVVKKTIDLLEEEFRKQDIPQKDDEINGQQSPTEITADSVECLSKSNGDASED